MTAPLPTAEFLNALARLYMRRAHPIIAALQQALDEERNINYRLWTAVSFADTEAAGYIDRSGLEA